MKRTIVRRSNKSGSPPNGFGVRARQTIAAPAAAVFAAWKHAGRRAHWLTGVELKVGRAQPPAALQLTCMDDRSEIAVAIAARGRSASAVVVDHTQLASAQVVAERRHCWKEMLRALKSYLERPPA